MDKLKSAFSKDSSQSGQEPLSGEQGLGSKGEPYDAGNVGQNSGAPGNDGVGTKLTSGTDEGDQFIESAGMPDAGESAGAGVMGGNDGTE